MKKNNKGFSLIELSIVLIIMGLLIAGVTGGASLVKSAKLRAAVTELMNYRAAFNTYYAQFGKVPGACNDDKSKICGWNSLNILRENGFINKDVKKFNIGHNAQLFLVNAENTSIGLHWTEELGSHGEFPIVEFAKSNIIIISRDTNMSGPVLTQQEAQYIDDKMDDGKSLSGSVRGIYCASGGGETVVKEYSAEASEYEHARLFHWSLMIKMDF